MEEYFRAIADRGVPYVAGQVLGIVVILWSILVYTRKNSDKILIFKLVSDALSIFQYLLCGNYTGSGLNVVMCMREIVFYNRKRRKWASGKAWLYIFIVLIAAMPFLTSKAEIFSVLWFANIFPALGSGLAVIGLYDKNAMKTRIFSLIGVALWLVYVIIVENYISILANIISLIAIIVGLIGDIVRRKNADANGETEQ